MCNFEFSQVFLSFYSKFAEMITEMHGLNNSGSQIVFRYMQRYVVSDSYIKDSTKKSDNIFQ